MAKGKPDWLKVRAGGGRRFERVRDTLRTYGLRTVCDEACCPNKGECWDRGTATFMILGSVCTRNCGFCVVESAVEGERVDPCEPSNLAKAVRELGLDYVVVTSVDRDDLPDKGAGHYAECIRAVKGAGARVEVLIPDYVDEELKTVVKAGPGVLAHNIEVVEDLQHIRDGRASYGRSLRVLREAKEHDPAVVTKSSILLGFGEGEDKVHKAMDDLRGAGCDVLVMGQYLRPSARQVRVREYVTPERFAQYSEAAQARGFRKVVSEPLARTSYRAA